MLDQRVKSTNLGKFFAAPSLVLNLRKICNLHTWSSTSFRARACGGLKRSVDFANLREAFFQAVSNSSWANESYLVAAKWQTDDDEFTDELARLSQGLELGRFTSISMIPSRAASCFRRSLATSWIGSHWTSSSR